MKTCPICKTQIEDDSIFCTACGTKLPTGPVCQQCGTLLETDDIFCHNCGAKVLAQKESSANIVQYNGPVGIETSQPKGPSKCYSCGSELGENAAFCTSCGKKQPQDAQYGNNLNESKESQHDAGFDDRVQLTTISVANHAQDIARNEMQTTVLYPHEERTYIQSNDPISNVHKDKNNTALYVILTSVFLLLAGVSGYLYYDMVYLPEKIDREATRFYTMAEKVVLRSSRSSGADYNKLSSLPYGTELITYERDAEWSKVKVKAPNSDNDNKEGFVASPYTLNKPDFFLLNSIFGNPESREVVNTTKCRLALLNYYKANHLIGKIDEQERTDAGIEIVPDNSNQWQVVGRPKDAKQNIYLFKRLYNKQSQFTDFAVIITNIVSGERRLLYFYFDDDETPHLLSEQPAPQTGFIKDIIISYNNWTGEYELSTIYFE